ncbi:hypothetical protein BFJ66_g13060 [Fusarium oxysporum f. sp. cepae]|uniref:Uncharacterized protein n=1 Tax=Fusarium oxysporum f. sp. cepae TaxID=396571 RepID=A0A3L6NRW3_FUSOX|nr:hypothetical protein BFJ65_g7593 [Fusarium oxysporum f. sp. cepae]RKK34588.1 hypothetical protein BFJ67_g13706 [Fusarium oxysporum f. sp. cepae]RKK37292.1 hypothetical protein BFJ66_g13060 [Fusarium oxysporum f. sp. cepae]
MSSSLFLSARGYETVIRSTHVSQNKRVYLEGTVFPLDALTFSPQLSYTPLDGSYIEVPPLCYTVLNGSFEDLHNHLANSEKTEQFQRDIDYGLFFANLLKDTMKIFILLEYGANPGRPLSSNGLHGAARRGQLNEISKYALNPKVSMDVQDETFATPVIYAMDLNSPHDWDTIEFLFIQGASPKVKVHNYTYAQIARQKGKSDLAQKLEAYKGWTGPLHKQSVIRVKQDKHSGLVWVKVLYECPRFPNEEGWNYTLDNPFSELDDDLLVKEATRVWERKRSRGRRNMRKGL